MSSALITSHGSLSTGNRRVSERKKLAAVVLLFLEEDNWGRLINISEAGMSFEFLRAPSRNHTVSFIVEVFGLDSFAPPRSTLQAEAQLIWANESNKTAGVQFMNLTADAQQQINLWLSSASSRCVDEIRPTHWEKSNATEAQLRKLFSTTLKTPDQVTISAYRQYLHASFSQLRNAPDLEILDGEARVVTGEHAEPTLGALLREPLITSAGQPIRRQEESQPAELQSIPVDKTPASEAVEIIEAAEPEASATQETCRVPPPETHAELASEELPLQSDISLGEPVDQDTSPELVAGAMPIEVVSASSERDIPLPTGARVETEQVSALESPTASVLPEAIKEPEAQEFVSITLASLISEPNASVPESEEFGANIVQETVAAESIEAPQTEEVRLAIALALSSEVLAETPLVEPTDPVALLKASEAATPLSNESQIETLTQREAISVFNVRQTIPDSAIVPAESINSTSKISSKQELDPNLEVTSPPRDTSARFPSRADRTIVSSVSAAKTPLRAEFSKPTPVEPSGKQAHLQGAAILSMVGCFVLLLIVGSGIMLSRANHMAAAVLLENINKPFAKSNRVAPPNAAVQPFQVEVVDIHNRRRLLNFNSPAIETKSSTSAPSTSTLSSATPTFKNAQSAATLNRSPQPQFRFPLDLPQNLAAPNLPKGKSLVTNSADSLAVVNPRSDAVQQQPGLTEKLVPEATKDNTADSTPSTKMPAQTPEVSAQPPAQPTIQPTVAPVQPSIQQTSQYAGGVPGAPMNGNPADAANLVQSAVLISAVPPVYPADARYRKIEGNVVIDALITEAGHIATMKVISGPSLLRQAALESLRKWEYKPARLRGQGVPVHLTVTINFHLR